MSFIGSQPKLKGVRYTPQSAAPSNAIEGQTFYSDGTALAEGMYVYKNSVWISIGSENSAGINYILASSGDSVQGWSTYADAAGSSPVDGTGGAPTVTFAVYSSSPLRGINSFLLTKDAANRQGEGASYDFTIDTTDKHSVMTIEADVNSSANFADDDIGIFIYDVTNAAIIEPVSKDLKAGEFGKFKAQFQTASNSTSYRLCVHVASTNAAAYTVQFDNIKLGPSFRNFGAPVTDWKAFTPSSSWSTNVTHSGFWRRVGDTMEVTGSIAFTGDSDAADLTVDLPSGYTVDTAKIGVNASSTILGKGSILDTGTVLHPIDVIYSDTNTVKLFRHDEQDETNDIIRSRAVDGSLPIATYANGDRADYYFKVPISGWGSSVQMSDDADTREVCAVYKITAGSSNISIAAGATEIIDYDTKIKDTHNWATVGAAWKFQPKISGDFEVSANTLIVGSGAAFTLRIYKNGAEYCYLDYKEVAAGGSTGLTGSAIVPLDANDYLDVRVYNSTGGALNLSTDPYIVSISKISGPSAIAANELIIARASGDAASSSVGNPVIFPTTDFDSHGCYNSSTGLFTTNVGGKFRVSGYVTSANATITLNICKDGATDIPGGITDGNGEGNFTGVVSCLAGQTLSLEPSGTLDVASGYICFERIGF